MTLVLTESPLANGDGKTCNTAVFQAAVDQLHAAGGGTLVIPPGRWLTGTVRLRSRVILSIERGAQILGSTKLTDYPEQPTPRYRSQKDPAGFRALFYADEESQLGLTGPGLIDGQGEAFSFGGDDMDARPRLLQFISCRDVRVERLHLRNSALWMQHYLDCENVIVHGLEVWNHANRNNDMMDIDGCRRVIVSDCIGDTDDDGITLKSTGLAACENVVVANCVISSRCNAIKCGTESTGGFRQIAISNCVVTPSAAKDGIYGHPEGISAVSLEIVDGGTLEGITISNLAVRGTRSPFFIRLGDRARPHLPGLPRPLPGKLRNVQIQHVNVTGAGCIGSSITGLPDACVENISFANVAIENAAPGMPQHPWEDFPERRDSYPEATMWGPLPASGFIVRHARNVRFENVRISPHAADSRPAFLDHNRA